MKVRISKLRAMTPELAVQLSSFSAEEARVSGKKLFARSRVWLFTVHGEPLVIVGAFTTSFVGSSLEIWVLLFKHRRLRELARILKSGLRHLLRLYDRVQARTEDGTTNERLVKYFGFRYVFTGRGGDGKLYQMYEARKSWAR